MPQEFEVVRCFSCKTFQVQQVKKSNKWKCKLCGEAQSLKKVYGRGRGIDCRKYVQELNLLRRNEEPDIVQDIESPPADTESKPHRSVADEKDQDGAMVSGSRWSRFLDVKGDDNDVKLTSSGVEEDFTHLPAGSRAHFDTTWPKRKSSGRFKPYSTGHDFELKTKMNKSLPVHSLPVEDSFPNNETSVQRPHNSSSGWSLDRKQTNMGQSALPSVKSLPKKDTSILQQENKQSALGMNCADKSSKWSRFVESRQDSSSETSDCDESLSAPCFEASCLPLGKEPLPVARHSTDVLPPFSTRNIFTIDADNNDDDDDTLMLYTK